MRDDIYDPCQILRQLVNGFWSADTLDFAIFHSFSWLPLQQCKHHRTIHCDKGIRYGREKIVDYYGVVRACQKVTL